ncbi:VWA domain-containing protein [Rugosimonospora africana]|uniref:VWFA domain-containing protein n=1 Tax=Rugosimonospora africana TaxID=556532 RepID=A0A8J3VPH8_9ACTN|nr:VWA domain-containing protein [Rugosimonospora africana]GIH14139.1 hypothetical protein Raf01_23110 [Rugosimonospora africana]
MSFHVYPDPQTDPLSVAAGATAFTPIAQLTGPPVVADSYNKMMFIRVAMFAGASPPTLLVKAGTGDPVAATTFTTAVYRQPGTNGADYVGDVQLLNDANNVYRIRMGFDRDTAETWQLGITNTDGASREFTWVVAQSESETAQPWIVVTPAALPYHSLVNQSIDQSVQVSNKGTGSLSVTGVSPALPSGFAVSTALPVAVDPSGTQSIAVTFTAPAAPPAPNGATLGTANLTTSPADSTAGTSAGHNQQLSLTATTQRLEVVLLLDDSGSMSWDALGTILPPNSPSSRWSELASATNQFLDLLAHFGQNRGRFGIARFPAGDPLNPATYDIVPMTDIPDVAGMATAQAAVAAIQPLGGTPMGDGLDRVLAPATSYFGTDALSVNADRRWLILMSDGAYNSGTHNPLEFIAPPTGTAPAGTSLAEKNVDLFAVAYGVDGHTDVNHVLMKQLADGSDNGQVSNVDDAGTTASQLALALRDTIKSGLTPASSPLDPSAVFVFVEGAENRHEVTLTQYDSRAAFVISWNRPDASRLRLELLTPGCECITPENAGQGRFAGVTFRSTDRSQMYLIDPEFLDPGPIEVDVKTDTAEDTTAVARAVTPRGTSGGGTSPDARFGTWTFVITSPPPIILLAEGGQGSDGVPSGGVVDTEHYVYDVIVDSTLRLEASQDESTYFAGDQIGLSARLTAGGRPVTGASVSLSTTTPAQSFANWLAALTVPADALKRAQEILAGQDATPILIKQLGAQLAGLTFDGGQHRVTLPMTDPDGDGTYRATFTDTSVPEHYTFYVTATGVTEDGVAFRREARQETFVQVRPVAAATLLDVHQTVAGEAQVTVVPRDQFGNVLLIDPATAGGFGVLAPGGKLGGLVSNLDGSYTTTVTFDPKHQPDIGLQFGGVEVIKPKPVPPVGKLHYPDRVDSFQAGQIKAANQHDEPKDVLGTVVDKPDGVFLALGAGGNVVVSFTRQVILASGDDDITVFVHPDTDLRSYRVEAYSLERRKWVPLGESVGVTESFSLRDAKLKLTLAVKVTDTSRRTRDANAVPLSAPGVSVRGIGVTKTSKDLPCDRRDLPDWFPW